MGLFPISSAVISSVGLGCISELCLGVCGDRCAINKKEALSQQWWPTNGFICPPGSISSLARLFPICFFLSAQPAAVLVSHILSVSYSLSSFSTSLFLLYFFQLISHSLIISFLTLTLLVFSVSSSLSFSSSSSFSQFSKSLS